MRPSHQAPWRRAELGKPPAKPAKSAKEVGQAEADADSATANFARSVVTT